MAAQTLRSALASLTVLLSLLALSGPPAEASLLRGLSEYAYARWGEPGTNVSAVSNTTGTGTGAVNGTGSGSCSYMFLGVMKSFHHCMKLDSEGKTILAWSPSPGSADVTTVFYQGVPEEAYGWSSWGISPTGLMAESDAVVGYGSSSSPGESRARQYHMNGNIPAEVPVGGPANSLLQVVPSSLSTEVTNSGNTVSLLSDVTGLKNGPVNVIWKGGPSGDLTTGQLIPHKNIARQSITIDFYSGEASEVDTSVPYNSQKVAHAFLSAIGFGILMPIGILVARHMKVWADPLWYYTHAVAQILGYVVGVAGWSIGIWLKLRYGDISLAPSYQIAHYGIGLAIFCSTTVQIVTPVVKPAKGAPFRIYWNLAHWGLGYASVILAIVNIFLGFTVLTNEGIGYGSWRTVYIVLISVWGGLLLLLEPLSWYKYFQNQKVDQERNKAEQEAAALKQPSVASV